MLRTYIWILFIYEGHLDSKIYEIYTIIYKFTTKNSHFKNKGSVRKHEITVL